MHLLTQTIPCYSQSMIGWHLSIFRLSSFRNERQVNAMYTHGLAHYSSSNVETTQRQNMKRKTKWISGWRWVRAELIEKKQRRRTSRKRRSNWSFNVHVSHLIRLRDCMFTFTQHKVSRQAKVRLTLLSRLSSKTRLHIGQCSDDDKSVTVNFYSPHDSISRIFRK
jgi:hypothetical protein